MADDERRARGISVYASQFRLPEAAVPDRLVELFGARMAEEGMQAMGGTAWDDVLPRRERSLIVVAALIALGGVEDRLRAHVRWAVDNGVTRDELDALVSMLAIYVGYPRVIAGMNVVKEELDGV
jgi:4-carboxymuconolactone decarboxylase